MADRRPFCTHHNTDCTRQLDAATALYGYDATIVAGSQAPLWPVFVAATPTAVFAVIGITTRYEMIITSLSGLYRYKTHKIITIVGRYHGIPTVIIEK